MSVIIPFLNAGLYGLQLTWMIQILLLLLFFTPKAIVDYRNRNSSPKAKNLNFFHIGFLTSFLGLFMFFTPRILERASQKQIVFAWIDGGLEDYFSLLGAVILTIGLTVQITAFEKERGKMPSYWISLVVGCVWLFSTGLIMMIQSHPA